jgi:phosphatidate cytidylyltransferase
VSNLGKRLLTAAVGVPILLALISVAPAWGWVVFVMGVAAVSAREYFRIVVADSRRMPIVGILGAWAIIVPLSLYPDDPRVWLSVAAGIPLLSLLTMLAKPGEMTHVPHRAGLLALGLLYTGLLPAFVALLRLRPEGSRLIILVLAIAFLGDTGGYFAGRLFGRHKLYPSVSPKKTWEGSVGGLLASAGAAVVAHAWFLPGLPLAHAAGLGVALGALGQAGDLCESMLKRAYDVKDSGNLLPGHGGMLDRIDAVLFAAPGLYLYVAWSGLP